MFMVARKPEEVIERWMLTIMTDGGVGRFDDLHIDKIDPEWADRSRWIESALEAFQIAVAVRDRKSIPFSVGLGFSLNSGDKIRGIDFQTRDEFRDRLNWSPPSLYLFHRGEEPHTQGGSAELHVLDPAVLGVEGGARCFYMEFKHHSANEYCRSVFVEG